MASRTSSRPIGHKKLATYGSMTRKKHSNLITTQEPESTSSPKKLSDPSARDDIGSHKGTQIALEHITKPSMDQGEQAGEQRSGRKRKRDDLTTPIVSPTSDQRETLRKKTAFAGAASLGGKRILDHWEKGALDMSEIAGTGAEHFQRPLSGSQQTSSRKAGTPVGSVPRQAPADNSERKTPQASRRPRLIDALAAQREVNVGNAVSRTKKRSDEMANDNAGSPLPLKATHSRDSRLRTGDRRAPASMSRKIKLTYSQSRSALSDARATDDSDQLGPDVRSLPDSAESPPPLPSPQDVRRNENMDDDVDFDFQPAIKSVHELRRSGANNRFADEMDDLLARIGSPSTGSSTMRRNALCELAQRLPKASFAEQFRDHASRDKVAKSIGLEEDLISGFALAASLVIFLKSGPAPHLVHQLSLEGLGIFLGRLLRDDEDIHSLASRRKTNLSRATKASLHNLKSTLMRMPIWHGLEPAYLSTRTLGLQLLETVTRCAEEQPLERVAKDLNKDLVIVAAKCAEAGTGLGTVNYTLAVFTLEVLSSAGIATEMSSHGVPEVQLQRSIAIFLGNAMQRWPRERGELEVATLKLAINTTNTKRGAAAFADADLLSLLADRIGSGFSKLQKAMGEGPLKGGLYDELVLLLGVMINIVEHNPAARASVRDEALNGLIALWHGNQQILSEADSVEKSKVSVTLGYLAVLLGYLCLTARGKERINAHFGNGRGIRSLVISIRDFVAMYRMVDSKVYELEALVNELHSHDEQGRYETMSPGAAA